MNLKLITLLFITIVLTACGGGGSSSSSDTIAVESIDVDSMYSGKRNKAILTPSNAMKFVASMLGRNSGDDFATISDSKPQKSNLNTFQTQKVLSSIKNLRLPLSNFGSLNKQARLVNDSIYCEQGGSTRITGDLENDNTGLITLDMQNCIEDGITITGLIQMNIIEFDTSIEEPSHYTISFNNLTMSVSNGTFSVIGSQSYYRDENYYETVITNMLQTDNFGEQTLIKDMIVNGGQNYSGKVYLEDYGYIDVSTPSPVSIDSYSNNFIFDGSMLLTGAASSKILLTPEYDESTYSRQLRVDLDQNGDGKYEYIVVQDQSMDWESPAGFNLNQPPLIKTESFVNNYSEHDSSEEINLLDLRVGDNVKIETFGTDPEGYEVNYIWTIESAPENSTAELNVYEFGIGTPEGIFNGEAIDFQPDVLGNYRISVSVIDTEGFSTIENINLKIKDNIAPSAIITDEDGLNFLSGDTLTEKIINLSGENSTDTENQYYGLDYLWTIVSKPNGSNIDINGLDRFNTLTVAPDISGTYVFSLEVTDSVGATDTDTISIYIPENEAPKAIINDSFNINYVGYNQTFDGWSMSTDREDTFLNYKWEITSQPPTSNLSTPPRMHSSFGFIPDVVGNYTLLLTVTDSHGASDTASLSIEITNNPN